MGPKDDARGVSYTEPVPIDEEFVHGAAYVEDVGGVLYLVFYVEQVNPPELEIGASRVIRKRIVIPRQGAERLVRMVSAVLHGDVRSLHCLEKTANLVPA
jgi:hypothetical protein